MANFVADTFADVNGTLLSAHTGQIGATWTELFGVGTAPVIESNSLYPNATNDQQTWTASGTPPSPDYSIAYTWTHGSSTGPIISVCARTANGGSAETCYRGGFQSSNNVPLWLIVKHVNGVQTIIGTAAASVVIGTGYTVVLTCIGSILTLSVNGSTVITVSDSTISAAGSVGVLVYNSQTNAPNISTLTAYEVVPVSGTLSGNVASGTSVNLSVTAASQGAPPYNYQFQRSLSSGSGYSNIGPNSTSQTYTNTGLTTGTNYYFKCVVTDNNSNTDTSNIIELTPTTSPLASGTLSVLVTSSTTATVSVGSASGGTSPYDYQFQRAPDVSGSPGSWGNIGPNSSTLFYNDTGLTSGNTYWYRCIVTDNVASTATSNQIAVTPGVAATYYIDSINGNDSNSGTSPGSGAWQTLGKASSFSFFQGDNLLLTSGQTFAGTLTIGNSGTEANPIIISTTGSGTATINTTVAADDGLVLQDCQFVQVSNITLTGPGVSNTGVHTSSGHGIYIVSTRTGTGPNFYLGVRVYNCTISGFYFPLRATCVNGTAPVGAGSGDTGVGYGYADLRINNVTLLNGAVRGISFETTNSLQTSTSDPFLKPNYFYLGCYIGNCNISNIYGDANNGLDGSGGRICDAQYCLVENLVVSDCGKNQSGNAGGPVGWYHFLCDSIIGRNIQVNRQQSGNGEDGGGFDHEGGSTNCLFENCTSRDCSGYGMMLFTFGGLPNTGNVYRNCTSVNDCRGIATGGIEHDILKGFAAGRWENCTVYSDATVIGASPNLIGSGNGPEASGCSLTNCVFILLNGTTATIQGTTTVQNNLYWFGSTGGFDVTYNSVNCTTLAALRLLAENVYGNSIGYNQNPGLSAPIAGQSCAQLLAAWNAELTGVLLTGGITPPALGSEIL